MDQRSLDSTALKPLLRRKLAGRLVKTQKQHILKQQLDAVRAAGQQGNQRQRWLGLAAQGQWL